MIQLQTNDYLLVYGISPNQWSKKKVANLLTTDTDNKIETISTGFSLPLC
jgi:hypothetical protein